MDNEVSWLIFDCLLLIWKFIMKEKNVEIELNLLWPEIHDGNDACLSHLKDTLLSHKGISHVHLEQGDDNPKICIHYNPNLISLSSVRRIAQKTGTSLSNQCQHERIPFTGMDTADQAPILRRDLEHLPGMLHADVNYAAGLAFIAYDSETLPPEKMDN